jgi:hypothetical protein
VNYNFLYNRLFLGFVAFIVFFSIKTGKAQFENVDLGARAVGLNGAFTSLSDNSLAIFYNPSGLGQLKYRDFSVFYNPAPFGLTELSTAAFTYAEPLKYGTIGAGLRTYGFELYKETNILFSYGNNYKSRLFYGANFNFYHLNIQNYGSATAMGIDVGAMVYINKYLRWGFFGKNITGSTIGTSKEKIAQVYRTGLNYKPLNEASLILEIEKDVKYPVSVRAGFEYSFLDYVDLRAGVGSEPTSFTGGIGFNYNIFQLDYAMYKSQDLGITHQGSLTVNFGGSKGRMETKEQLRKAFEEK